MVHTAAARRLDGSRTNLHNAVSGELWGRLIEFKFGPRIIAENESKLVHDPGTDATLSK
jgi:hypothetical protein